MVEWCEFISFLVQFDSVAVDSIIENCASSPILVNVSSHRVFLFDRINFVSEFVNQFTSAGVNLDNLLVIEVY